MSVGARPRRANTSRNTPQLTRPKALVEVADPYPASIRMRWSSRSTNSPPADIAMQPWASSWSGCSAQYAGGTVLRNMSGAKDMAPSAMNVKVTSSMRKRRTPACAFSAPTESSAMMATLRGGGCWKRLQRSRVVVEDPQPLQFVVAEDPMLGDPDVSAERSARVQECRYMVTRSRDAVQTHTGEVDGDRQLRQHDVDEFIRAPVHAAPGQQRPDRGFEGVRHGLGQRRDVVAAGRRGGAPSQEGSIAVVGRR